MISKNVETGLQEAIKDIAKTYDARTPEPYFRELGEPLCVPAPPVAVGDLSSNARGTGARMNSDKLPVELILVRHWVTLFQTLRKNANDHEVEGIQLINALKVLADFQEGDNEAGRNLLAPIPPQWFDEAAEVLRYGTRKYHEWNWLKGMPWSVPLACAIRHVKAIFVDGEDEDQESGFRHTGHFACNLMMLATYVDSYPEGNDFPLKEWFNANV